MFLSQRNFKPVNRGMRPVPVIGALIVVSLPLLAGVLTRLSLKEVHPLGNCPEWQHISDMPLDIYAAAGASDDTFFYTFGGYSFTTHTTLDVVRRYDPATDTWVTMAPMPQSAIMPSAVYYPPARKIFVFGGQDNDSGLTYDITRIYDLATNSWTTGTSMPGVRAFMASGYNPDNGKIYLVSGYSDGFVTSAQPNTWEYDPVEDTFTEKALFPHPAGGFISGVINGHLYVAGGRDVAPASNLVWDYNIAADVWVQRYPMPLAENNGRGYAVALGRLWAFGGGAPFLDAGSAGKRTAVARAQLSGAQHKGFPPTHPGNSLEVPHVPTTTNRTWIYDPVADFWTSGPAMSFARSFPASAVVGGKLVAAGGYSEIFQATLATSEVLDACLQTPTPTPTPLASCPPIITHSTSQEIVSGNSSSCDPGDPVEIHYWRAFDMQHFAQG